MERTPPAADPTAYVRALGGWRRRHVLALRRAVRAAAPLDEVVKWGHLVYFAHGPVLLIRAEAERVLFGFWRGKRLRDIEPRLKPGGKFELATMELRADTRIAPATVRELVQQAVALDARHGDPRLAGKRAPARASRSKPKPKARAKAKAKAGPKRTAPKR